MVAISSSLQTSTQNEKDKRLRRRVEYHPPAAQDLHSLAKATCTAIATRSGKNLDHIDVIEGLAEFLFVISKITAKLKTQESNKLLEES